MLRCLQIFVIVSMPAQKIFIAGAGAEKCRKLLDFIDGDNNIFSCVDLEARNETYAKGVKKPRNIKKSEQCPCGPDVPA